MFRTADRKHFIKTKRRTLIAFSILVVFSGVGFNSCWRHETALTIRVENGIGGHTYELRCDPPGGTAPQPARLCQMLAEHSEAMLFVHKNQICAGGVLSPHIYVKGRYEGKRVNNEPDACAGNAEGERLWFQVLPSPPST
jgi:hypothetical protein